ncbi:MAG: hypothetical protein ABII79_13455 [bacterium]
MPPRRTRDLRLVDRVDSLNEEVKVLALNLAIYLARAKGTSEHLTRMEPEFIRLVNGTVKVVRELAVVISSARNPEQGRLETPTGTTLPDQLEIKLQSILNQCSRIIKSLSDTGETSR